MPLQHVSKYVYASLILYNICKQLQDDPPNDLQVFPAPLRWARARQQPNDAIAKRERLAQMIYQNRDTDVMDCN